MGWEIHITRAEHWSESKETPITREEWRAYIETDPELEGNGDGNGLTFAHWKSHTVTDGGFAWFDWFAGSIQTKYPDELTLGKALRIAKHFGARVQGDDGEEYRRPADLATGGSFT